MNMFAKSERSELSPGVFITTTQTEQPITFTYEAECTIFKAVKITLDFQESTNMAVKDSQKLKIATTLRPFSRFVLGTLYIVDPCKPASLSVRQSWTISSPSAEETTSYVAKHLLQMQSTLQEARLLPYPPADLDPDNQTMSAVCLSYGKKFTDRDFPPTISSLQKPGARSSAGEQTGAVEAECMAVEWRRPSDFMVGSYHLFADGIEPQDIQQGRLGDCWFLCAIAALTEFPQLVRDLFEGQEASEHGVYRIRFCKNGLWQSVRVDDYVPCYPCGGPIYSRCNGNELWVMLLEKAFAKLCGSYDALRSGRPFEAMVDLTGAPCKSVNFDSADGRDKIKSGELWRDLMFYDSANYIMTASTAGDDVFTALGSKPGKNAMGLVPGHAYTLIAAKQTSKGDRLVKLRNPWGETEWTGAWSDGCPQWTDEVQAEVEHLVMGDDGIFWMCFEDFVKYFHAVNVCLVRHVDYHPEPWIEKRSRFQYIYQAGADIPDDHRLDVPIFTITLAAPGTFVAGIHQADERCAGSKSYIDIGVSVLRREETTGEYVLVTGTGNVPDRQVSTDELSLPAGVYLVVPTTTGIRLQDSVASEAAAEPDPTAEKPLVPLTQVGVTGETVFSDAAVRALSEIFDRADHDNDGYVHKPELEQFLARSPPALAQCSTVKHLRKRLGSREGSGLSKHAFLRGQEVLFQQSGGHEEQLRAELRLFGYNNQMQLVLPGRSAVLSIHGSVSYTLSSAPFDAAAFQAATVLPVKKYGQCKSCDHGKFNLYNWVSHHAGVSFVVENTHNASLQYTLDCSTCKHVVTHRATGFVHEALVPPGETRLLHHLLCDASSEGWSWGYQSSWSWSCKSPYNVLFG